MKSLLCLLFFIVPVLSWENNWVNASVISPNGFAPFQEVAVTLQQKGFSLKFENKINASLDLWLNNELLFSNVTEGTTTDWAQISEEKVIIIATTSNTSESIFNASYTIPNGFWTKLRLDGNVTKPSFIFTYITDIFWSCKFNDQWSDKVRVQNFSSIFNCTVPESLMNIKVGSNVTLNEVEFQFQDYSNFSKPPEVLPIFTMDSFWNKAYLQANGDFLVGETVFVEGSFLPTREYACHFTIEKQQKSVDSSFSTSTFNNSIVRCLIPAAFNSLENGAVISLVSVYEKLNTTNGTRVIAYAVANPNQLPQFTYLEPMQSSTEKEFPTLIVLSITVPVAVACVIFVIVITVVSIKRRRHQYEEIK